MAKQELVFSDYLDVILRRKWSVLIIAAIVAVLAYVFSRQEHVVYSSSARIKIQRQISFTQMFDEALVSSGDPIENYVYEIQSYVVASNAAAWLVRPANPTDADISAIRGAVHVDRVKNADLLDITTTGFSPEQSRLRAEAVVASFIEEHDRAMRKTATDVYQSIQDSHEKLIGGFKQRQASLLQSLGSRIIDGASPDDLAPLRKRLMELQIRAQDMQMSGNYTDSYPELMAARTQIAEIEKEIERRLQTEFERRTKYDEYERYRAIMSDIELFFSRRIEEAKIAVNKKSEVVLVIEPPEDGVPETTGRVRKTVAGALLGLMLGIILAFIADNLDTSVRTIEEIEDVFHLSVLGIIPHFSQRDLVVPVGVNKFLFYTRQFAPIRSMTVLFQAFKESILMRTRGGLAGTATADVLIVPFSPRAPATEAFRTLRTQLQIAIGQKHLAFLVTSASPSEGKTTTITNLAISFAQAGKRTLLISANMRRPQICNIFGLKQDRGLSDILIGELAWRDTIKDYQDVALGETTDKRLPTAPGMDNLFFITCGGRTIHPAEWLDQPILANVFKEMVEEYEIVLVDAPPVLPVPDSVILASVIKHTIVVYQVGVTGRESVRRAIASLQNAGSVVVGMVLNGVRTSLVGSAEFFQYRRYYGKHE